MKPGDRCFAVEPLRHCASICVLHGTGIYHLCDCRIILNGKQTCLRCMKLLRKSNDGMLIVSHFCTTLKVGPECRCEFLTLVQNSRLLRNEMKYTVQIYLSGSSIHVAYLYLTRVITYKLWWNCDVLFQPNDFRNLAYNTHNG